MNDHHFNVKLAIDFDPETAIFLNNMAFWLNITIANREHYFEGSYWIYNSYTQWSEIFPYWSFKQMRRIIDNAIKNGLLIKGCFNQKKYDNTNWYTLTDRALEYYPLLKEQLLNTLAQTGKTLAQMGRPIPYSNPYTNNKNIEEKEPVQNSNIKPSPYIDSIYDSSYVEKEKEKHIHFAEFWELYPQKTSENKCRAQWVHDNCDEKWPLIKQKLLIQIAEDERFKDGYAPGTFKYIKEELWKDEIIKRNKSKSQNNSDLSTYDHQSTDWIKKGLSLL